MATKWLLPKALGGGECTIIRPQLSPAATSGSLYVRVEVVSDEDGAFTIDLHLGLLTEVKEPLPEEPPLWSFVVVGHRVLHRRDTAGIDWWDYVDHTWRTWADVNALGTPTRLVPDPFAEPVELPWKNGHGVEVSQTRTDTGMGDQVYVSTKHASYGFAHVDPDVARAMALALWTAADAAEKEQS